MTVNIVPNKGHWEVRINGKFYCSADTFAEAITEYQDYMKVRNANENKNTA